MSPTFTVVIPTYNRPAWLREAVDSVLAQDFDDFECIVVDDASSLPLDLPADPRVRVIRHDANAGIFASLNTGIAAARGDFVTFLDDDDRFTPDRLSMTLPVLGRAGVVLCWTQVMGRPPDSNGTRMLAGDVYDTVLDDRAPPCAASVIARESVLPFDTRYRALGDLEWWLRTTRVLDVTTVPRVGCLVRHHREPRHRHGPRARIHYGEMLLRERGDYFTSHRRAAAMRWLSIGLVARELGDNRLARRALVRSLRAYPVAKRVGHLLLTLRPSTFQVEPFADVEQGAAPSGSDELVSVVLPVRNGEATIREAMESVLDQTLRTIELVVVDDASTDGTAHVLASFDDPRVRVISNAEHRGLVMSLHRGIDAARSDVIARMDADNRAYPQRLARQYELMRARPEVGLVATAYDRIDVEGRILHSVRIPPDHGSVAFRLAFGDCIAHSSVMFRRGVVRAVGGYSSHEFPAEDYGLWLRMVDVTQVATITSAELAARASPGGISATHATEQHERTCELAATAIERLTGRRPGRAIVEGLVYGDPPLDCARFDEASWYVVAAYRAVHRASRARGAPYDGLVDGLLPMLLRCGLRRSSGTLCLRAVATLLLRHPMLSARLVLARLLR
jgi:glycosyltransferase involved in cell wall biosynthesis